MVQGVWVVQGMKGCMGSIGSFTSWGTVLLPAHPLPGRRWQPGCHLAPPAAGVAVKEQAAPNMQVQVHIASVFFASSPVVILRVILGGLTMPPLVTGHSGDVVF